LSQTNVEQSRVNCHLNRLVNAWTLELRCKLRGHRFTDATIAADSTHILPLEPKSPPHRYCVHRALAEGGPWTRPAKVASYEADRAVIERWRHERPDVWWVLMLDGTPVEMARPRRAGD
jgi:hypothetical protein